MSITCVFTYQNFKLHDVPVCHHKNDGVFNDDDDWEGYDNRDDILI